MPVSWVLIDETNGAQTGDGAMVSPSVLNLIIEAVTHQLNCEFATEYGGPGTLRRGANAKDILPGERVYSFVPTLPNLGISAYHDINGQGVPVAFCAVTTCGSLYGNTGISIDVSHEILEAGADEGCNQMADDNNGTLHMKEVCDPVEVQSYRYKCNNGTIVQLSNFVLRAFFDPNSNGPYDYMCSANLPGAIAPAGPMQTAISPSGSGNYQLVKSSNGPYLSEIFGSHIIGSPRKPQKVGHWSSRAHMRHSIIFERTMELLKQK
jgi:hypothetical protein